MVLLQIYSSLHKLCQGLTGGVNGAQRDHPLVDIREYIPFMDFRNLKRSMRNMKRSVLIKREAPSAIAVDGY